MKGDFTKSSFDPKKHYRRVPLQQGRVQLDAEWNEQIEIDEHRIETEAVDVIGKCGAPLDTGGPALPAARGGYGQCARGACLRQLGHWYSRPFLQRLLCLLQRVQSGIESALREQLGVFTLFDHAAMVEHDDQIGVGNRAQAVTDHDRGAITAGPAHIGEYRRFGASVER